MVRYAILGPVELRDGERAVAVGGPRQVALLALFLVNANRALSSDRLIDVLWGDQAVGAARKRLQMAIARLRQALDPHCVRGESVLRTVSGGYLLAVRPGELDADVFVARVQEGRRALQAGQATRARSVLREALGMWCGPALADVAYEEFAQPEIRRLEEVRMSALELRLDCELQLGEHDRLIAELESLVVAHPGRERLAAQLMLSLYRCGRQGDALETYARTRAYLTTELGLEPGPTLQALQTEILAQSPTLQPAADESRDESAVVYPAVMLALPHALNASTDSLFVGRDTELERLRERWTQTAGGQRVTALVGGEPGIGKTRLAAEFARAVHGEGALVLHGRCDEGLAVPYQPFVQALRPYARATGLDRLQVELGALAAELGRLLPELAGLGEPSRADPESERFALFDAIAALIETVSREQPTLIVLDDLHWAADPTLLLLRHLIRSERPLAVMLLCTYRETELDLGQRLAQLVADLHREASTEHLSLRGLNDIAITALLQAAVGHRLHAPGELVGVLRTQTAGNPFFVHELLVDITESDTTSPGDEHLSLKTMAARLEIPEGLRYVIGQRVARLPAPARRLLRVAAVAGATFSFVLLEHVLDEQSGVLDALDQAVAAGLLIETEHGDYVFSHALVRRTIYDQLSTPRRIRLHRQLGEALEASGDPDAHIEALAYHFAQAAPDGQALKAADYARAAGRSATARLGYEDAAAHYERALHALTLTGQTQDQRRCELLLALGQARWDAGELNKARHACQQAAELADKLGNATALAHAALGFCGPHRIEVSATVMRPIAILLQRALTALDEEDSPLRARLLGRLAYTYFDQRKHELARAALEMARRVADKATLADVLASSSYWALHGPDTLHESLARATELGRVADGIGDRRLRALAHRRLLEHLLEQGDIQAAEHELEALQRLAETPQGRYMNWLVAMVRAGHAYLQGQLEHCETLACDAHSHRFEGHDETAAQYFGMQLFLIRREQGRLDELMETIESFVKNYPGLASWRCALASAHAQLDRTVRARHELEGLARAEFSDLPRDALWMSSMSALSEVVAFLNDTVRAQLLYDLLRPYTDRCVVAFGLMCQGSVCRHLGLLATTLSRYEDAAQHFEHALKVNAQIRTPLWIAHTQHDYARMLLQRNCAGDLDQALRLLDDALETAEPLKLQALADKTRPLKRAAEAGEASRGSPGTL